MVHLDYRSGQPIYSQIIAALRSHITTGVLQPGDKLPSVRELAAEIAINPNTIQRAYRELEQKGVIETVPGKGCFVCSRQLSPTDAHLKQFDEAVQALKALGVTEEELTARMKGEQNG